MTDFPLGFSITWDGQRYTPVGVVPYLSSDSVWSNRVEWKTTCPDCFQDISITTGLDFHAPTRRCSACKAPGKRVRRPQELTRFCSAIDAAQDGQGAACVNSSGLQPDGKLTQHSPPPPSLAHPKPEIDAGIDARIDALSSSAFAHDWAAGELARQLEHERGHQRERQVEHADGP